MGWHLKVTSRGRGQNGDLPFPSGKGDKFKVVGGIVRFETRS